MAEEVTPLFDIIILLVGTVVVLFILFFFLYCNYFDGICPGKWVCNWLFGIIIEGTQSLIGRAILGGISRLCDFVPM